MLREHITDYHFTNVQRAYELCKELIGLTFDYDLCVERSTFAIANQDEEFLKKYNDKELVKTRNLIVKRAQNLDKDITSYFSKIFAFNRISFNNVEPVSLSPIKTFQIKDPFNKNERFAYAQSTYDNANLRERLEKELDNVWLNSSHNGKKDENKVEFFTRLHALEDLVGLDRKLCNKYLLDIEHKSKQEKLDDNTPVKNK